MLVAVVVWRPPRRRTSVWIQQLDEEMRGSWLRLLCKADADDCEIQMSIYKVVRLGPKLYCWVPNYIYMVDVSKMWRQRFIQHIYKMTSNVRQELNIYSIYNYYMMYDCIKWCWKEHFFYTTLHSQCINLVFVSTWSLLTLPLLLSEEWSIIMFHYIRT